MQISRHFTLEELTRTSQPFPNIPGPREIANLTTLCNHVLEPVRLHFGRPVRVTSGFRSLKVNRAIGSKDTSQHRLGEAADIEIAGVSNAALAQWIIDNLPFDQIILENYVKGAPNSGWVHVSYREGRLRRSIKTMRMGSHGPVYLTGLVI